MAGERKKENPPSAGKPSSGPEERPAKRTRKPAAKTASKSRPRTATAKKDEPKPVAAAKQDEGRRGLGPRAPARQRGRRPGPGGGEPSRTRPTVRAQAKYVRSSARKARLVIDHIRGKSVGEARAILGHAPRAVARDIEKLLASAVANAENNHELVGDELYVKEVYADEGPTLKRFRPRAYGRATKIRKRTTHLTLTLTPKE